MASELNVSDKVPLCDTVTTALVFAETVLISAGYKGPAITKAPSGERKEYAIQLMETLDYFNNSEYH